MKTIKEINKKFDEKWSFCFPNEKQFVGPYNVIKFFWNEQILSLIEELEGKKTKKDMVEEIEKVKMKPEGDYIKISGSQWYLLKKRLLK